jgi:hypothetical protein
MTTVLLVEKLGNIKPLKIKEYNEEDFYKKCGYKSSVNFKKQHTWKTRIAETTYWIALFAKSDVRGSLGENKYEFPPPIAEVLYFGTCLLAGYVNESEPFSLTPELWTTIYTKLYGGFENLADTADADENELDELEHVPAHKKTKDGYLKDGFVVDEPTKKVSGGGGGGGGSKSTSKPKKSAASTSTSIQPSDSAKKNAASIITQSTDTNKKASLSDDEPDLSDDADDDDDEDDDDSTVYTDVDDDDEDTISSCGKGGKGKRKAGFNSSAKKKGTLVLRTSSVGGSSQKEDGPSIEIMVNELLITDELKEEPYIE